jgi:bifunctional non-homologous end joining protein LigD
MNFIKPMLPTLTTALPTSSHWFYEIKYDGFRCQLHWDSIQKKLQLYSRNGNDLLGFFPEMHELAKVFHEHYNVHSFVLDGELCCLEENGQVNFETIQFRGKLKNCSKQQQAAKNYPATFLAFDFIQFDNGFLSDNPYVTRKERLLSQFKNVEDYCRNFKVVTQATNYEELWKTVLQDNHEGVIAKHENSKWQQGTRTNQWLKIKNYKQINVIVTGYDRSNGYFIASVYKNNELIKVGTFIHGMTAKEQHALRTIIEKNATKKTNTLVIIKPSIVVLIKIIGLYKGTLREPRFVSFELSQGVEDCTWEQLINNVSR